MIYLYGRYDQVVFSAALDAVRISVGLSAYKALFITAGTILIGTYSYLDKLTGKLATAD